MRKLLTTVFAALIAGSLFGGGLVTNTNQSAAWVRLPARNASVGIDAVYFNPAGLTKLEDGFHLSVSNQTIFQTKTVENFYTGPGGLYGLNESLYEGDVAAPIFPAVYFAYKKDRMAFSFGFNPVGGGGGAEYAKGLPSFELSASDLVPSLASQGAKQYRLDAYLKGSSVYFGLQGGVSFKINDWLSVAAGLRYVMAKNKYEGHLKDIELNVGTIDIPTWTRADGIMTTIAAGATSAATSTTALVGAGAGSLTLAQAESGGFITALQRAQLEGALTSFGSATTVTIAVADAVFKGAAAKYTATATLLGDQNVDVEQAGTGVTPIFSVNISPSENLNIAVKYEWKTRMDLENTTTSDFLIGFTTAGTPITMFPDGDVTPSDMPAMLAVGLDYKLSDALKISLGSNYFFDKTANYGHKLDLDNNSSTPSTFVKNEDIITDNGLSLMGGLEFNLSDKLLVSGGYVFANQGVNSLYQSDLTYGLATHTFGAGGAYKILNNLQVNIGASYTLYQGDEKMIDHVFSATGVVYPAKETYNKNAMIFAVGLDFSF
jgi:long-subunit fatty acid transport protein